MLKKSICILSLVILLVGVNDSYKLKSRIYNGFPSVRGQFPYFVLFSVLKPNDYRTTCGGSIISNEWIITAAHCVINASRITVHLGSFETYNLFELNRRMISTSHIISHPHFDLATGNHDLALIKLPQPIQFNQFIQSIDIMHKCRPIEHINVTAIGVGQLSPQSDYSMSHFIRFAPMKIIPYAECKKQFPDILPRIIFCTASSDWRSINYGDSGGPIISEDNKLIGVISYGHTDGLDKGMPQIITNLLAHYDFISKITGLKLPRC